MIRRRSCFQRYLDPCFAQKQLIWWRNHSRCFWRIHYFLCSFVTCYFHSFKLGLQKLIKKQKSTFLMYLKGIYWRNIVIHKEYSHYFECSISWYYFRPELPNHYNYIVCHNWDYTTRPFKMLCTYQIILNNPHKNV